MVSSLFFKEINNKASVNHCPIQYLSDRLTASSNSCPKTQNPIKTPKTQALNPEADTQITSVSATEWSGQNCSTWHHFIFN